MNLTPFVVSWSILATAVLILAIYRARIARSEDDVLHVEGNYASKQEAVARKLENIDKWGKILTVIAGVFALILFAMFLYNGWFESSKITG